MSDVKTYEKISEKKKPHLLPHFLISSGVLALLVFVGNGGHL